MTRTDWPRVSLKRLVRFGNGTDHKNVENETGPYRVFGSGGHFARATDFLHDGESVLFGRKGTIDKPLYVNEAFWTVDTVYYTIIGPRLVPRWFYYWATTIPFTKYATQTALPSMTAATLGNLQVQLPSVSEQKSVADFLDRETAQIDAMIEAQEALATIAGERRRAVIHHYVTKGLATGASLKNTPLKWLGEIPEHWEVANIRRHAEMKTGHTPSRSVPEYWVDCDIPWITLADVWQLRTGKIEYIENTDEMVSELGIANSAAELLPAGTVVLSRTASVGFSGIMATPMATSQDYWNWICKPSMLPEYLLYVFRAMEQEFQALRRGSTHQTIYQPVAASFRIPVPPLDEQRQIVEELRQTLRRTDELLEEIAATTALLRERREALITAAVTGRIDPETGIEYPENPETPKES